LKYVSTRGGAPALAFDDVLLTGLAPDGGLYLPARWPRLTRSEIAALAGLSYAETATRVMAPFVGAAIDAETLARTIDEAYAGFDHPAVAPLRQIGSNDWLLELFHGPTLAFKDYALQLVGRLFDHVLAARRARVTIVGATSGDTGAAAIEALRDRDNVVVCILHPKDRISEIQRRQMTTVTAANVHNVAIEGTFDDCQALLKAMFADADFRAATHLSAVNSINWARVMAQTVYYVTAAVALGAPHRPVSFSVPTGNFGDIFAGHVARRMGLPIESLVIATNRNDILARFVETGRYQTGAVVPTLSPSMDIQVASNFERYLYELLGRDGARVAALMETLARTGGFAVDRAALNETRAAFAAHGVDDAETEAAIASLYRRTGMIVDPHTATGIAAATAYRGDRAAPMITLATAHPAKFPDAVTRAIGAAPPVPPPLAGIESRPERCAVLPNDLARVKDFVRSVAVAAPEREPETS